TGRAGSCTLGHAEPTASPECAESRTGRRVGTPLHRLVRARGYPGRGHARRGSGFLCRTRPHGTRCADHDAVGVGGVGVYPPLPRYRHRHAPLPATDIGLLNGPACGGGFALALATDVRIATPTLRLNAAFIRIGFSACDMG